MEKDRLLASSDGVIAIIITIMVFELHAPPEATSSEAQLLRDCVIEVRRPSKVVGAW
jgi:uncharacterized membrane protein